MKAALTAAADLIMGGWKVFPLKFHWRILGQGSPKVTLDSHFNVSLDVDQWTGTRRGRSWSELGLHNAAKTCGKKLIYCCEFSAAWFINLK